MQYHTHVLAPAAVEVATSLDVVRAEEPLAAWLATTRITLIHACSDGVRAGAIDPGEAERIVRVSVLILVIGRPDDQDLRVVDLRSRREVRPEQRQQFLAQARFRTASNLQCDRGHPRLPWQSWTGHERR